jgi:hypothetical protein
VSPFLKVLTGVAVVFMTLALVGLATGMGARHPRFTAENVTQVAGSYGGISFMVLAVQFIVAEIALLAWPSFTYLWHGFHSLAIPPAKMVLMGLSLAAALVLSLAVFRTSMRRGVEALEEMTSA